MELKKIAVIRTDFPAKFGIPRQSGLADTEGTIIFEPEYRSAEALRGIEEYSHLWILWGFTENRRESWTPTVRPPRLGGNTRVGVFATRSPFRPNPIGLSCVELEKAESIEGYGMVLKVRGADMMDGTEIYDIKPYLPYVDAHPEAAGGFAEKAKFYALEVEIASEYRDVLTERQRRSLEQILAQDPRPSYQKDPLRVYGMEYGDFEVKFRVEEQKVFVEKIVRRGEVCGV